MIAGYPRCPDTLADWGTRSRKEWWVSHSLDFLHHPKKPPSNTPLHPLFTPTPCMNPQVPFHKDTSNANLYLLLVEGYTGEVYLPGSLAQKPSRATAPPFSVHKQRATASGGV